MERLCVWAMAAVLMAAGAAGAAEQTVSPPTA